MENGRALGQLHTFQISSFFWHTMGLKQPNSSQMKGRINPTCVCDERGDERNSVCVCVCLLHLAHSCINTLPVPFIAGTQACRSISGFLCLYVNVTHLETWGRAWFALAIKTQILSQCIHLYRNQQKKNLFIFSLGKIKVRLDRQTCLHMLFCEAFYESCWQNTQETPKFKTSPAL